MLRFNPKTTLVLLLLLPEPQKPEGGPMENGPKRESALGRLRAAYEQATFEQWQDSTVWWMPGPVVRPLMVRRSSKA